MRLLLSFAMLAVFCIGCEKETPRLSSPRFKPLVGNWKLTEILVTNGQDKSWQPVLYHHENDIDFQPTGVIMDYKGEPVCCHPRELVLNGSIELVNYPAQALKNSDCSISCLQCQVWTITHTEDEMIVTGCLTTDVRKYKR